MDIDVKTLIDRAIPELISIHNGFYPILPVAKEGETIKVIAKTREIPHETLELYRFKWGVDEIIVEETVDEETINKVFRHFLWEKNEKN